MSNNEIYIKVTKDGPYIVYGTPKMAEQFMEVEKNGITVRYEDGEVYKLTSPTALCRCGHSQTPPFCDGQHTKHKFEGEETASFQPIREKAEVIKGPNLTLLDNDEYCAYARFCDAGDRVWNLVMQGNNDELAIREACDCPAGRLIILDNNGNEIEPKFEPTISPLEDAGLKISGPLWVKGHIRVESANGKSYEVRNRQTLCRCGESTSKPFCDGTHAAIKYKAKKKT